MSGVPTGVFDSGAGGPIAECEIRDQLPRESLCHSGDTQRTPVGAPVEIGPRGTWEHPGTSATTEAIPLVTRWAVPVTRNDRVGAAGMVAAVSDDVCDEAFSVGPEARQTGHIRPAFIRYVQRDNTGGRQLLELPGAYLAPFQKADVDTLTAGRNRHLSLTGVIGFFRGEGVTLVSSAERVERTVGDGRRPFTRHDLFRDLDLLPPVRGFPTDGDPDVFRRLGGRRPTTTAVSAVSAVSAGGADASVPSRSSSLPASSSTASSLTALAVAR